ncbi:RidA family protein [Dyella acidiphila]|uniref:RidA family protein n=1 Tax=Dyella acidiphila TaxID=2775866 RepID=A0ABR9GA57_9GAMM|nr:RidA family protein [Dyella acidiphila]MBE1160909.1 RidA family protein [Dyella acidiphila]
MSAPVFSNPDTLVSPPGYTQLVEVSGGKMVFIAGQVALDAAGVLVGPGNFALQADQVFRNLRLAMESRGGSFKDIIKISVFITDMAYLPAFREARDRHLADIKTPPASTLVQVAGLFRSDSMLEIEAVAWMAS